MYVNCMFIFSLAILFFNLFLMFDIHCFLHHLTLTFLTPFSTHRFLLSVREMTLFATSMSFNELVSFFGISSLISCNKLSL